MTISPGEKHQLITFPDSAMTRAQISEMAESVSSATDDLIIDLSRVQNVDAPTVDHFIQSVTPLLDDRIVILIGDEDALENHGFLAEEFPVTPTYNEAIDFLFMLQLEKDLGLDE
ncbi:MAG: hypothetical protein V4616_06950 [Bacteroidota bacterium]